MASPDTLGPLLRLWGIKRSQLPSSSASPDELTPFLTCLLAEAIPFIDSVSPKSSSTPSPSPQSPSSSPWIPKSTKSLPHSTAPIRLLERRIPAASLHPLASSLSPKPVVRDETWACRLSVHDDEAVGGTASWEEFRRALKERHVETERQFTPSVVAARRAVEWDCGSVRDVVMGEGAGGGRWGGFTLGVAEMRHKVGRPVLKDRVFAVLQMTASLMGSCDGGDGGEDREEKGGFVVVSVTVDDFGGADEAEEAKRGDVVVGRYVSVERVRKIPLGGEDGGKIEWIMATASDARGNLPAWVQKGAVPGQIAKDVSLFLGWMAGERRKKKTGTEGRDGQVGGDTAPQGKMESVVAPQQRILRKGQEAVGGAALM